MTENQVRESCSIARCQSPAIHSEYAQVGHWFVTIFYCDEHSRQLAEGTPLGAIGVDPGHVRIEPMDTAEPPATTNRFPGIA